MIGGGNQANSSPPPCHVTSKVNTLQVLRCLTTSTLGSLLYIPFKYRKDTNISFIHYTCPTKSISECFPICTSIIIMLNNDPTNSKVAQRDYHFLKWSIFAFPTTAPNWKHLPILRKEKKPLKFIKLMQGLENLTGLSF